jgi:[acyl-carrier-protein] S-malonyltransferase
MQVWKMVLELLNSNVETVLHVGPDPKILPSTFLRVSNNVTSQLGERFLGGLGWQTVARIIHRSRPWLKAVLSSESELYRAPFVQHVILEDWLLEQKVP